MGGHAIHRLPPNNISMETKRCAYCHKVQYADAHTCSHCGRTFILRKSRKPTEDLTHPSIPPASPHRAGHYAGLHPEDQPYQSSKIVAIRHLMPKENIEVEIEQDITHEPTHIILPHSSQPDTATSQDTLLLPKSRRSTQSASYNKAAPKKTEPVSPQRYQTFISERIIPLLITSSCIFFLLASSIIAFALIGNRPTLAQAQVNATPNTLRVNDTFTLSGAGFGANHLITFTYDALQAVLDGNGQPLTTHTDSMGRFSVQIRVPGNWKVGIHTMHVTDSAQNLGANTSVTIQLPPPGPPKLQLSTTTLHFDAAAAGVVSTQTITLTNAGGDDITWQSSSDQPWLTTTPNTGTFSGSASIQVKVNRGTLTPQEYTGHLTFRQNNSTTPPITLTVTMTVQPAPAALSVSTATLAYSATASQNPADQIITLENSGGQALDWTGAVMIGGAWLSFYPHTGHLNPKTSEDITVSVASQQLAAGYYQGTISFAGDADAQVTVALNVVAPGNIVVSPPSLNLSTLAGQQATAQTLTLQNSGGVSLDWTASATTVDKGTWLSVTPQTGTLDAGTQSTVTVNADGTALKPGAYQGTLTFTTGGVMKLVAVSLTVTAPPLPAVTLQPRSLTFNTYKAIDPAAQTLTITNSGNAPLNWNASISGNVANLITITPTQGSALAPGKTAQITVTPHVGNTEASTLTATITIADSDNGTTVASQTVALSLTIIDQAAISVASNTMNFANTSALTKTTQLLVIHNVGSANLNWAIAQANGNAVPWLSFGNTDGTLGPGDSTSVDVNCNSANLTPGTYTASLVVSDSNPGTSVAPQVVNIVLVVGN